MNTLLLTLNHQNNPGHSTKRAGHLVKSLVAALALSAAAAHAEPPEIRTFDIFADPPSAFAFIKMPQGWTFIGKLDEQTLRVLPASVHTSVLDTNAGNTSVSVAGPSFIWSNINNGSAPESDPVDAAAMPVTSTFIWSNVDHAESGPNPVDAATISVNPTFI